jgi:hypothetical protein
MQVPFGAAMMGGTNQALSSQAAVAPITRWTLAPIPV